MNLKYDVCIIGAGVNGSATAYALAKEKKNVLLLEQDQKLYDNTYTHISTCCEVYSGMSRNYLLYYLEDLEKKILDYPFPVPHTRGSSHGQSRIIRCLDPDKDLAKLSYDSFAMWRSLEKETDEQLLIQNGMLEVYSTKEDKRLKTTCQVLGDLGVKYDLLTADEVNRRFSLFNVPKKCAAIYEHGGGMVFASKCVAALQKVFVRNGGVFRDGEQVLNIIPGSDVTIITTKGKYITKSLVITAGSFTSKLTRPLGLNLPLRVERTHACYWKLEDENVGSFTKFPSFKAMGLTYGLAAYEYPGLIKICSHHGPVVNIDYPEVTPDHTEVTDFIKQYMKGVAHQPSVVERCLYTVTPDRKFVLDNHPRYHNIIIGAGFSGSGFKMAPATGTILAGLALGKKPHYDISEFRINRFAGVVLAKASL